MRKWGMVVSFRGELFNVQSVRTPGTLQGRAITPDLTVLVEDNLGFNFRLIGVCFLGPGGNLDDERLNSHSGLISRLSATLPSSLGR